MSHVTRSSRLFLAFLAAQLLAGCAFPLRRGIDDQDGSRLVATDEPLHPAHDSLYSSATPEPSRAQEIALAAARLVANDGQLGHPVWRQEIAPLWTSCERSAFSPVRTPLEERGVFRTADPLQLSTAWLGVGLAFGANGVSPWILATPCGTAWPDATPGARLAGLDPAVAGRDTSLLFTTARAKRTGASVPGWVNEVIDNVVNGGGKQDAAPRTAKPRPDPRAAQGQDGAAADHGRQDADPPAAVGAQESSRRRPRGMN